MEQCGCVIISEKINLKLVLLYFKKETLLSKYY